MPTTTQNDEYEILANKAAQLLNEIQEGDQRLAIVPTEIGDIRTVTICGVEHIEGERFTMFPVFTLVTPEMSTIMTIDGQIMEVEPSRLHS